MSDPKMPPPMPQRTSDASCDITVDGERFDITNLLGSLPSEDVATTKKPRASAVNQTGKRSSLAKFGRSSHHYPQLGGLNLYSLHPRDDHDDDEEEDNEASFSWTELDLKPAAASSGRRMSTLGVMSELTTDFCQSLDCPGLAELQESMSSFSDHYAAEHPSLPKSEECHEIEIGPGVFLPFRGSDETWAAIKAGRACSVACFDCSIELIAAQDCQHAICPQCHTVNPIRQLEDYCSDHQNDLQIMDSHNSVHFGVLMGFKKEWCGEYYDLVQHSK